MSTNTNTKHVTVAHAVPRDPEAYRMTTHFGQRVRERLPPEPKRGRIIRECIERGECHGESNRTDGHEDVQQYFRFDATLYGRRWRTIVGIRPQAFKRDSERHLAITIMEVDE